MPDFHTHTIDSVSRLKPDSLLADSLRTDSIAAVDALKLALNSQPTGMEGILHPSYPGNESWVFIVISVLFFFLVTGIIQSAGTFVQNFKPFFSRKNAVEIIAKPTANIAQFQLFITIFSVCVFALFIHEILVKFPEKFQLITFAVSIGVVAGYYLLKYILFEIIGITFFDVKTTKNYKSMYFSLMNLVAILLFPILILYTFQPISWQKPLLIAAIVIASLASLVLIMKLFQIFYTKPLALFYIFLYLCTLEILPLFVLILLSEKFIKSI
ncbi:MAG: DUF4271 domain-containing protein [Porphyromonadaceae bacterium]|nr:DUF4271 domain-containing protein [Porphyromonadaceae bacterium]